MAGHTGISSVIKISQIAHACGYPLGMRQIWPCMRAQPERGWTVAVFAGNPVFWLQFCRGLGGGNLVYRRVTNRAPAILAGLVQLESLGDLVRAATGQSGKGAGMKVLPLPDDDLVASRTGSAVAT